MPINPSMYKTASNAELFTELERLTILVDNVDETISRLDRTDDPQALELIPQLRTYLNNQVALKGKLQQFIINTRKG